MNATTIVELRDHDTAYAEIRGENVFLLTPTAGDGFNVHNGACVCGSTAVYRNDQVGWLCLTCGRELDEWEVIE